MPMPLINFPTLTPQQTSPYANLVSNMLSGYTNAVQAKYAPQQIQADIFSKQFAPLAQIASNPLAMAMMGDKGQGIMSMISSLLQNTQSAGVNGSAGSVNMQGIQATPSAQGSMPSNGSAFAGEPDKGSPGYNAWVANPTSSGGVASPSVLSQGAQDNSNLPSGSTLGGNLVQRATAPGAEQLHAPGTTYRDMYNNPVTTATPSQMNQGESIMTAIKNVKPMLPKLLDESKEFENKSLDIKKAYFARLAQSHGLGGIANMLSDNPDLAGDFSNFQKEVNKVGIQSQPIYPGSDAQESFNKHISNLMFDPSVDTVKSYGKRLQEFSNDMDMQYKNAQQQAGAQGGYNLAENAPTAQLNTQANTTNSASSYSEGKVAPAGTHWWKRPDGQIVPVHITQENQARNLNYQKVG